MSSRERHPAQLSRLQGFLYRLPWFSRRRQGSLVVHLMALAFAWGVLVYLIAVAGLWWTADRLIKDSMQRQAVQWFNKLDELGTTFLISGVPAQFEPIRKHVSSFPEVTFLRYLAADGVTELARYAAPGSNPALLPEVRGEDRLNLQRSEDGSKAFLQRENTAETLIRISGPAVIKSIRDDGMVAVSLERGVLEDARVIGYVDLGLNFHIYRKNLSRHIFIGSVLTLTLFIGATLVGRFIILRALRPLADLQIPLARLAEGDTDIEVQSGGATEIAAIGHALRTTIDALKERDRELKRLAVYDNLTGLFNRYSFNHALQRERARVSIESCSSALLFIDLDRFKEVNDAVGHAAGDELLIQVAQRLRDTVRNSDTVSRLGGDEFTIILHDVSEAEALQIADKICVSLREFVFTAEGQSFRVQCSIGITLIDSRQAADSTLLSQADTACQEAKKLGRNGFKLYREIALQRPQTWAGSGIREQLEQALAREDFVLDCLPVVAAGDTRPLACHAALQLRSAGEEIPFAAFQFAAERFDLIQPIDRYALRLAVAHLAQDAAALPVSLLLSGRTILQPDVLPFLHGLLEQSGVDPARLTLALGERTILENVSACKGFFSGARLLGCRTAIDDFGVSLNSLALLKDLPVDALHVEAAIANGIEDSPFNRALLVSLAGIARELGIRTVAKQVTSAPLGRELQQAGIDELEAPCHHG